MNDTSHVGYINPLRYRGYYYDNETGMYYLQSRYYNPEVGRFLNADGLVSTGQGLLTHNMFAYSSNNPIMFIDPTGMNSLSMFNSTAVSGSGILAVAGMLAEVAIAGTIAASVLCIAAGIGVFNDGGNTLNIPELEESQPTATPKPTAGPTAAPGPNTPMATPMPKSNEKLHGQPGEIKHNGNEDIKIGADGKAVKARHNTNHSNSKYHSNPHDHEITWDVNGKPDYGDPINYDPSNVPNF